MCDNKCGRTWILCWCHLGYCNTPLWTSVEKYGGCNKHAGHYFAFLKVWITYACKFCKDILFCMQHICEANLTEFKCTFKCTNGMYLYHSLSAVVAEVSTAMSQQEGSRLPAHATLVTRHLDRFYDTWASLSRTISCSPPTFFFLNYQAQS